MEIVLLFLRIGLAGVMATAGLAKLADLSGSRQAMADFEVPARLAGVLGLLLPLAEVGVALLLLSAATAWWGAAGAAGLLLIFIAGIALNLARGRRPNCHCFGQLHSAPIGRPTLIRNAVLLAAALAILLAGREQVGPGVGALVGGLSRFEVAVVAGALLLLAALLVLAWFVLHLLRQQGRLLLRLDALEHRLRLAPAAPPVRQAAPAFELPDLSGSRLSLAHLLAPDHPLLLLFADPDCGPCRSLLPEVHQWQQTLAGRLGIAVVSRRGAKQNPAEHYPHGLSPVLLQTGSEVALAYGVQGTPAAVLIHPDGSVDGAPLHGVDAIRAFVAAVAAAPAGAPQPVHLPQPLKGEYMGDCNCGQQANGHHNGYRNGHRNGHSNGYHNGHAVPVQAPRTPRMGEAAPALRLPDLEGRTIALAPARGESLLVLFWNPGCGYCARLLPELKAWEAAAGPSAPRLLVVSTGSVEANRAMGLQATVVLDPDFSAGRAFGAGGTPSAVLLDGEGRLAADVAVGAPAVLGLLGGAESVRVAGSEVRQ